MHIFQLSSFLRTSTAQGLRLSLIRFLCNNSSTILCRILWSLGLILWWGKVGNLTPGKKSIQYQIFLSGDSLLGYILGDRPWSSCRSPSSLGCYGSDCCMISLIIKAKTFCLAFTSQSNLDSVKSIKRVGFTRFVVVVSCLSNCNSKTIFFPLHTNV